MAKFSLSQTKVRLQCDTIPGRVIVEEQTLAIPVLWVGSTTRIDLAICRDTNDTSYDASTGVGGSALTSDDQIGNLTSSGIESITVEVKSSASVNLISKTTSTFDDTLTYTGWNAGTAQHAYVELTDAETNLAPGVYPLAVSAVMTSGAKVPLGTGKIQIRDDGTNTMAGDPEENPSAAISRSDADARYIHTGSVTVRHGDGTQTVYEPEEDTDEARGDALALAFAACVAGDVLTAPPGDYLMHTMTNLLVSGVVYQGYGARLYIDGTSTGTFADWLIYGASAVGDFLFAGFVLDGVSISGKTGAVLQSGSNRSFRDVTFQNWSGNGLWNAGGNLYGNTLEGCRFLDCGIGFLIGGEYWQATNCLAEGCTTGVEMQGGNSKFANCNLVGNTTGLLISHGSNDGHGVFSGGSINHNTTNFKTASDLVLPFTLSGAHLYAGNIDLNGCGAEFVGCHIASEVVCTGTQTGVSFFIGCRFPQAAASTYLNTLTAPQRANVRLRDCYTLTDWDTENE